MEPSAGSRPHRLALGRWTATVALACALLAAFAAAGLPSPELFAGLVAGVAIALAAGWALSPPRQAVSAAQAVLGVALGTSVQASTIRALGSHLLPVIGVSVATLALTVAAGLALARFSSLDRPTASFSMIAGGASGIVAIADELGADNRIVAVLQYLRVLIIVVLTPLVSQGLPHGTGAGAATARPAVGLGDALLLVAAAVALGLPLARLLRLPAGSLLGPMMVAAVLTLAHAPFAGPLPGWAQGGALVAIGLQVGLRFTPASLREAGRALAPGVAAIALLLVGCAALGLLLAPLAHVTALDGYLATTPGGLYAVLGTAFATGANTTFVLAVQVLRLFTMLLAAPVLARRLRS